MAYFAKLDSNNIVTQVLVVDNDNLIKKGWWDPLGLLTGREESEKVGISFCQNHCGDPNSMWVQTSYGASGQPGDGHKCRRGNYAGIGYTYMKGARTLGVAKTDIFISQRKYASWHLGVGTAKWYPPDGVPDVSELFYSLSLADRDAGLLYRWNEENYQNDPTGSTAWVLFNWRTGKRI